MRAGAAMAVLPFLLFLALTGLLAAFEEPFKLSATEVDLLVAGPFHRRQLVNYKIGHALYGRVVLSLLIAPSAAAVSGLVPAFVGYLLIFSFLHLFALVAGLLGAMLGLHAVLGLRRWAITMAILCGVPAVLWLCFGNRLVSPIEVYRQVDGSVRGWDATLPLRWFFEVILAKQVWPDLVWWSALCLLENGVLFVTVHLLDAWLANRPEKDAGVASLGEAERPAPDHEPWALPLWSRCRGLGAIVWRQSMNVVRKPELIAFSAFLYGILIFFLVMLTGRGRELLFLPTLDGHLEINPVGAWVCGVLAIVLPMLIAAAISFDFRSDMEQIDVLKSLPIKPIVLTAGQLFVPVAVAAGMQWLAIAIIAISLGSLSAALWLAAAFVLPVSVILMATENLLIFWFPVRHGPGSTPQPFELIGRVLLHPLVRSVAYGAVVVATLTMSAGAYFLFGQSASAALAAAWLTLTVSGLSLVVLLADVFDRFDVTRAVSG
jgi:hypothetical protein